MGVGLAVGVLLDATMVRGVLLPATMKLLGERNWYLPRWLGRAAARQLGEGRRFCGSASCVATTVSRSRASSDAGDLRPAFAEHRRSAPTPSRGR